ncbi:hypothetical protein Tco_0017437 [Tanacetum coccineum]
MDRGQITFGVIGFSSSLCVRLPILKNWRSMQMKRVNSEMASRALEEAEVKLQRYEERHDRVLGQICSFYMHNQELETALAGCRDALSEASEFVFTLRRLQLDVITTLYPVPAHGRYSYWLENLELQYLLQT